MANETETRKILNKTIAECQETIDKAKFKLAELDELDKPELRCGDYGGNDNGRWIHLYGETWWIHNSCQKTPSILSDDTFIAERLGNLDDDLKRNSEDLKEFKVDSECFAFKGVCSEGGRIHLQTEGAWTSIETATEIHQKLGRMLAFAKRIAHGT